MQWASAVLAVLKVLSAVILWWQTRDAVNAALAQSVLLHLQKAQEEISEAKKIRESIAAELRDHPERLRDDDGFSRD